jgi:hypothetical protein
VRLSERSDRGDQPSQRDRIMTEQPSCLCVREGHPGRQDVGHYDNGVYVKTGDKPCMICDGTGVSPALHRARLMPRMWTWEATGSNEVRHSRESTIEAPLF